MPAKSEAQRRLFGAALAIKRGKAKPKGQAGKIAKTTSESDISDFAHKKVRSEILS